MEIRSAELLFAQDEKSRDRLDGIDGKIAFTILFFDDADHDVLSDHS